MDWDDLRFLLAVAHAGSASAAARALGVDKATIARRVSGLEAMLGVRLLLRRATGWVPTAAGRRAAATAREIERQIAELRGDLAGRHGAPRTLVTVTAPHWFCADLLLPALPELVAEAPWLDVAVAATSRVLSLPQREADVALRNRRPEHGDFVVRRAGELGSAIYAASAYAKRHRVPTSRAGWAEHRLVGYADRLTYVDGFKWLEALASDPAGRIRTDDAKVLAAAVRAGLGVGVIPCLVGDADPRLRRFGDEVHRETIWLVSPAELAGTRAVKLTASFVAGLFRRHAGALAG
jgi:DNA-binding transcriptional LysR family regulator